MTGTSPAVDLEHLLAEEGFVRSLARSLLFDEHQVDDVVQQTWLQALRRPPATAASPRGWLAQVVRSQASNVRRSEQRRRDREQAVVDGLPSNDEILGRETRRREIVEAAVALPEPYRSAILLRYFEQLPPRVIAVRLGVPRGTVATRLKRALQMLRSQLDERNDGDRRGWCLALIPIAAPPRAAAGMLLTKVTGLLGVLWAMKQMALLLVAIAAMLVLGLSLAWNGEAAGVAEPETVPAVADAVQAEVEAEQPNLADKPSEPVTRRRASGDAPESPSVQRALAGFSGRLLLPGGEPAADQLVRVIGIDPSMAFGGDADPFEGVSYQGPASRSARTDSDGRFMVEGVWPGALCGLHAGIDGPHPGLRLLSRTPGPSEVVDLGDVELSAKGSVLGQVVGPDGDPVADAEVWAVDLPGAILDMAPLDRFGPGSALFMTLPHVDAPRSPDRDPEAYGEVLRRHVSMKLFRDVETDGWVVMEMPAWANRFVTEWPIPRTRTAADGTFRLEGVDPGPNVLVVRRPGLATGGSKRVLVKSAETRDVGSLRLSEGEQVSGVVIDGAGQPVAGAHVRVAPRPALGLSGLLFSERLHTTDGAGRFVVTGLPRGSVVVAARRAKGTPWAFADDVEAGDEDIELPLHAAQIELQVQSSAGDDLDELEFVVAQGPPIGELSTAGLTPALDLEHCLTDLDEGRYRLHELAPGFYTVHVKARGHAATAKVVRVDASSTGELLVLELSPQARCVVEVVDRRGAPVHGARVYAQPAVAPAWAHSVVMGHSSEGFTAWSHLPRLAGRTDETGHLEVTGLPVGEALFSVRHPAFGAAAARVVVPRPQRFVLEATGSIRGRLFDRGEPAQPDKWRLLAISEERKTESGMPRPVGQALPDADGHYVFRGLAPGPYTVYVESSLADVTSFGALFEKLKGTYTMSFFRNVRQEDVVVQPGQEARLDLDIDATRGVPGMPAVRLSGRITVDGAPAAGVELRSGAFFESLLTKTQADGGYVVDRLRPQTLWLNVVDPRYPEDSLFRNKVIVRGDRDLQLDIELRTGTLRGRVLAKTGEPAAGHTVRIGGWVKSSTRDSSGSAKPSQESDRTPPRCERSVKTDADGRFEVRVSEGTYTCRIAGAKGRVLSEEITVAANATVDCEITLRPDGVLAGKVVLDQPISQFEWLWVRMQRDGERDPGWFVSYVEDDGTFHFADAVPGRYQLFLQGSNYEERKADPHIVDIPEGGRLEQVLRAGDLVRDPHR